MVGPIHYDYKSRKNAVEEILQNTNKVNEVKRFPSDANFTYDNAYKSWAAAIFVDLRDSTELFGRDDDIEIAKVVRGFTSEIIEILRKEDDGHLKEIGIRGDCVFAVYSAELQKDLFHLYQRAFYVNTYMNMLNKLLTEENLPTIKAGIGLAANETLAVKAGRKTSGIHNLVWIGKSVATAAKLSDLANKDGIDPIAISSIYHYNLQEFYESIDEEDPIPWRTSYNSTDMYYHADIVDPDFADWIEDGMPED